MPALVIPARFTGPPNSGNGGWTAGEFTSVALGDPDDGGWSAVEITLRNPPPLETPIEVRESEDGWSADLTGADPQPIAGLRVVERDLFTPEPVSADLAASAAAAFSGFARHPFPGCFACGTNREDGLRIFPGDVPDGDPALPSTASPWTPDASIAEQAADGEPVATLAATWAALDCPGGWSVGLKDTAIVLGRMTARVDALPVIGEPHVVVGQARGQDGRKRFAATALYDADQRLVGVAEQTWFVIEPEDFNAW